MLTKRTYILLILLIGLIFTNCEDSTQQDIFKAVWVYVGPPGDGGWTYAHNQGRLAVEVEFGDKIETSYMDNVAETESAKVIQKIVDEGADIVFTTSFGFQGPTHDVATTNPETLFENCSGYLTADNMAVYFGRMYEARYLTGVLAGLMIPEGGKVGMVAAHPIAEVVRHINAITLGLRSVNPTATMHIKWAHAWYDPEKVTTLANELFDNEGIEIIFQDLDSNAPVTVAKEKGKKVIGYNSDVLSVSPSAVLTSAVWNWKLYYKERIQAALDGNWSTQNYWGGIGDGIVGLGQWGDSVPDEVRQQVEQKEQEIISGTLLPFAGPILKQDGSTWFAEGEHPTDEELLTKREILVEGVAGEIPERCDICD